MSPDSQETLELSTFIHRTLLEIIKGVEDARDALQKMETNAEICPTDLSYEKGRPPGPYRRGRGFVQEVEFDVAITVSKGHSREGSGKGGLSIGVPSIPLLGEAGIEGEITSKRQRERSDISRVTFRIPVLLPSEDTYVPNPENY
jgi:hypothetical protein